MAKTYFQIVQQQQQKYVSICLSISQHPQFMDLSLTNYLLLIQ